MSWIPLTQKRHGWMGVQAERGAGLGAGRVGTVLGIHLGAAAPTELSGSVDSTEPEDSVGVPPPTSSDT